MNDIGFKLQKTDAPHVRVQENVGTYMRDVIFALVFPMLMSLWYHQLRAAVVILVSVGTCYLADALCLFIQKKKHRGNLSSIVTGLIIALLMPASVPYYVVVVAGLFAILVAKHPFGGLGSNLFNPACVGIAFAIICWNAQVLMYPPVSPIPADGLPIFGSINVPLSVGPEALLQENAKPLRDAWDLLFGAYEGPMGTTSILVIFCCTLFLLYRRVISWHIPVSFIAVVAVIAAAFPRYYIEDPIMGRVESVVIELCLGAIFFAAVFVASDPVTSPTLPISKIFYGMGCGAFAMLFRHFGRFSEGVVFSILIMNVLGGILDKFFLDISIGNGPIKSYRAHRLAYKESEEYTSMLVSVEALKEKRKQEASEHKQRVKEAAADRAQKNAELAKKRAEEKAVRDKERAEKRAEDERKKAEEAARKAKEAAEQAKIKEEKMKEQAALKEKEAAALKEKEEATKKADSENAKDSEIVKETEKKADEKPEKQTKKNVSQPEEKKSKTTSDKSSKKDTKEEKKDMKEEAPDKTDKPDKKEAESSEKGKKDKNTPPQKKEKGTPEKETTKEKPETSKNEKETSPKKQKKEKKDTEIVTEKEDETNG